MVGYAGSQIKVLGRVKLSVRYRECRLPEFQFNVTASGTDILGLDLFDALGFQICWEQQELASHTLQSVEMLETVEDKAIREDFEEQVAYGFQRIREAKYFVHCPLLNAAVPPVIQPLRRLPLAMREDVSKELKGRRVRYH